MNLRPWLAAAAATALALGASTTTSAAAAARPSAAATAHQGAIHPAGWSAVVTKGFHRARNVHVPRATPPHLTRNPQHLTPKGTLDSTDWSGYVAAGNKGVSIRYLTADFNVPSLNCAASPVGTEGTGVGQWIGFDGFSTQTLEQVGVGASCVSGAPEYYAWYDMAPSPAVAYDGPINPGDAITASVYYNVSNGEYTLYLEDDTAGAGINANATCPSGSVCHSASAEVITEVTGEGPSQGGDLADFAMENITDTGLTSHDGYHGSLAASKLWSSNQMVMVDSSFVTMAQPSALYGGLAFSDAWLAGS
jgi:hypothetical protein